MLDILRESIAPHNLPVTILLGLVLLYWIISLLGLVDLEFLDSQFDLDVPDAGEAGTADQGLDLAGTHGAPGQGHGQHAHHPAVKEGGSGFVAFLRFLNAGDVPILVILSFVVVLLWMMVMILNHVWNPEGSEARAGLFAIPALVGSLLLTKLVTKPLAPFFRRFRVADEVHKPVIGRSGMARMEITEHHGQIEVEGDGAPLLLNARVSAGQASIARGAEVLVVAETEDGNAYLVRSLS